MRLNLATTRSRDSTMLRIPGISIFVVLLSSAGAWTLAQQVSPPSSVVPAAEQAKGDRSEAGSEEGPVNVVNPTVEVQQPGLQRFLSHLEFWLALLVLIFGAGVIWIEYLILVSMRARADDTLRVFGLTLIIIGTLFALTAGFGASDIAPVMGLFGTIAGYLLGRRRSHTP